MAALPEYRTRSLLQREGVPTVRGTMVTDPADTPDALPPFPIYLKAQIPGATSRKEHGLVRRVDSPDGFREAIAELLAPGPWGTAEGVLITEGLDLKAEYYAGCVLNLGSEDSLPGGVLLFSPEGGSGVEGRSGTLLRLPFSLLDPPSCRRLERAISDLDRSLDAHGLASYLEGLVRVFLTCRLTVLETNPVGLLADGTLLAVDCRAEFEPSAVSKEDRVLFFPSGTSAGSDGTPLERTVDRINTADPSGTGFFRENRDPVPSGAIPVATNLCGGGGKMLWEMTTGFRTDIYTMNESDTSGGLSAFKSYRILRVVLAQPGARALVLTGSGMAFQNQHHLAAAVWKALRESPTPLPCLLRFGGTDQDRAADLFGRVSDDLPVKVLTFPPEVFPNAMVDDLSGLAESDPAVVEPPPLPDGEPDITVDLPPARIYFHPDRWSSEDTPPSVTACPTGFLHWDGSGISVAPDTRCTGCLMCETAALLDGRGELTVVLDVPWEVE